MSYSRSHSLPRDQSIFSTFIGILTIGPFPPDSKEPSPVQWASLDCLRALPLLPLFHFFPLPSSEFLSPPLRVPTLYCSWERSGHIWCLQSSVYTVCFPGHWTGSSFLPLTLPCSFSTLSQRQAMRTNWSYQVPRVTVSKYHKTGDLKQQKSVVLQFC